MIHWTPEGSITEPGLNIYFTWGKGKPWLSLSWVSVELATLNVSRKYFRIRTICSPYCIYDSMRYNIIENYKFDKQC